MSDMEKKNDIDWEQRRYEIACHMMPNVYGQTLAEKADSAIMAADLLIERLKNTVNNKTE